MSNILGPVKKEEIIHGLSDGSDMSDDTDDGMPTTSAATIQKDKKSVMKSKLKIRTLSQELTAEQARHELVIKNIVEKYMVTTYNLPQELNVKKISIMYYSPDISRKFIINFL